MRVYEGNREKTVPATFQEIVIATPRIPKEDLGRLVNRQVAIVRASDDSKQWDLFANTPWSPLDLPGNVFVLRAILISTPEQIVSVRTENGLYALKPGEVLLILG